MIGYRRSSNKLIVSTSWLSMCYSSKSSAGTWLLHFNSSLAKLTIYYSMCWLRSEKMNWLLIRVALRGHRGETTHSLAISVSGGLFSDWDRQGRPRSLCLTMETSRYHGRGSLEFYCLLRPHQKASDVKQLWVHLMISVSSADSLAEMCRSFLFYSFSPPCGSARFLNKSLTSGWLWNRKLWGKYLTGRDDL